MLLHFLRKINFLALCLIYSFFPIKTLSSNIWNVPIANDFFVGRTQELFLISELLNKTQKISIVGSGGIGKTQLAKAYAHKVYRNYDIIWWFDAEKNMSEQFSKLALELSLHYDAKKIQDMPANHKVLYVKNTLRSTDKSWLLIFDNVNKLSDLKEYLPDQVAKANNHHILFTSKNKNEIITKLPLKKFDRQASLLFFNKTIIQKDKNLIEELASSLDDYPLALAQAAAYINANNISLKAYLTLYKEDHMSLLNKEHKLISSEGSSFELEGKSITKTLSLSLEKVKKESNEAYITLLILSLMDMKMIKEGLLRDVLLELNIKEDDFKKSIRVLKNYSLIEDHLVNGPCSYIIQDTVKSIVKKLYFPTIANNNAATHTKSQSLNEPTKLYILSIIHALNKRLNKPWGDIATLNVDPDEIQLAHQILKISLTDKAFYNEIPELIVTLLECSHSLFFKSGNEKEYLNLSEKFFTLMGSNQIKVSEALKARYFLDSIFADFIYETEKNASYFEEQILNSIKWIETSSPTPQALFLGYISVAQFYIFKGNLTASTEYLEKAKPLINQGINQNFIAQFWFYLSWLSSEKGDYVNAKTVASTFLKATEEPNVTTTLRLFALEAIGTAEMELGNFEQAGQWAEKCYSQALDYYKSENEVIVGHALLILSKYHTYKNRKKEAIETAQKSTEIFDKILNNTDPSRSRAHVFLGEAYHKFAMFKEAFKEYKIAEKSYHAFYKNNLSEIREVSNLYANIARLGVESKDYPLAKKYLSLLVTTYSLENPNTLKVLSIFEKHGLALGSL
jgi:hypothetical protein